MSVLEEALLGLMNNFQIEPEAVVNYGKEKRS
jgi:hypothetical protein